MIQVLSLQWENETHRAVTAVLQDMQENGVSEEDLLFGGEKFPYGVQLDHLEGTAIETLILEALNAGTIPVSEYTGLTHDDFLASEIRVQRTSLLEDTDYLMQSDYPITEEQREQLREYRQALRDITKQEGFPVEVVWPEKPSFI